MNNEVVYTVKTIYKDKIYCQIDAIKKWEVDSSFLQLVCIADNCCFIVKIADIMEIKEELVRL